MCTTEGRSCTARSAEGSCKGCKWHDDFSWACVNGESEYRGDFVNDGCKHYEKGKIEYC